MTEVEGDDWNDELLILEYNRSVRLVDERIEQLNKGIESVNLVSNQTINDLDKIDEMKKDKRKSKKKNDSKELLWKPGDHCVAVFKDDGIEYEAKIVSIDHKYGCCVVKYLGYDNEELQYLQDLKPTKGPQSQLVQMKLFHSNEVPADNIDLEERNNIELEENEGITQGTQNTDEPSEFIIPEIHHEDQEPRSEFVLPPPPTFFTNNLSEPLSKENDALASMLMSWYMCGYHTGYYTCLKQGKGKQ